MKEVELILNSFILHLVKLTNSMIRLYMLDLQILPIIKFTFINTQTLFFNNQLMR